MATTKIHMASASSWSSGPSTAAQDNISTHKAAAKPAPAPAKPAPRPPSAPHALQVDSRPMRPEYVRRNAVTDLL